jgi:uncharacterized protein YndB with AHSA1/START domain
MPATTARELSMAPRECVLAIERVFQAPRHLVWEAFTKAEHLRQWMGPRRHPAVAFDADVRPGGQWRGCLRALDGDRELWQGGVFRDVERPRRLVYTFRWDKFGEQDESVETLITITFEAIDDGATLMKFHQATFNSESSRDGHNEGWNSAFGRLDDLMGALKASENAHLIGTNEGDGP